VSSVVAGPKPRPARLGGHLQIERSRSVPVCRLPPGGGLVRRDLRILGSGCRWSEVSPDLPPPTGRIGRSPACPALVLPARRPLPDDQL